VTNRGEVGVSVQMLAEMMRRESVMTMQKIRERSDRVFGVITCRGDDLDAVAGRKNQPFADSRTLDERMQRPGQMRFGKRQAFAHFDGRGFVTDSNENYVIHNC
jgi:hypothetical protein